MTTISSRRPALFAVVPTLKAHPVILALIASFLLFTVLYPERFLTPINMSAILRQFVTLALFGLGASMVVVIGSLDLSYVGIWMLGSILVWLLMPILGLASIFVIPVLGLVTGLLVGLIQVRAKIPSFILTLSLVLMFWGITAILSGGYPRSVREYGFITATVIPNVPTAFLLSLPIIAAAIFIMKATKIGTFLYAIGSNEEGAQLAGVNVDKYKILAFTLSGLFTGIGGLILFQHLGGAAPVNFNIDNMVWPLLGIVLGGTPLTGGAGGPQRTILGALTFSVVDRGLMLSLLPAETIELLVGFLLIVSVVISTRGLKGVNIA